MALLLLSVLLPVPAPAQLDPVANAEACRLLCKAIEIRDTDGDLDSAISFLHQAIDLHQQVQPTLVLAELYYRVGSYEAYQGNLELGLSHLLHGDSLAKSLCPGGCLETAQAAHELGTYYWFRDHNLRLSRDYLESALEAFLEVEHLDTFTMSTTMLYLGYSSRDLGEYSRALELLKQALEIRKRQFTDPGSNGVLIIMTAIAKLHFTFDEYTEAKRMCEDALTELSSSPNPNPYYLQYATSLLALSLVEMGECDAALRAYEENLTRAMKGVGLDADFETSITLMNIAHVYHRIGDNKAARAYFSRAAAKFAESGKYNLQASLNENEFGDFFQEQGEYDSALVHNHRAMRLLVPRISPYNLQDMPTEGEAEALFELKDYLFSHGEIILAGVNAGHFPKHDLDQAIKSFDLAIRSLDAVWLEFDDPGDKLAVNRNGVSLYGQAVDAAHQLWLTTGDAAYLSKMHDYIERSKAQLMLETMRRSRAAYLAGIPDTMVNEHHNLHAAIDALNDRLEDPKLSSDSVTYLNQKLLLARKEYSAFTKRMEADYPRYSQLVGQRSPATLENLQAVFQDPEDLFLEYHITDSLLYCISVHKGKSSLRKYPLDHQFENAVRTFLEVLSSSDPSADRVKRYILAARALYKVLLQPEIDAAGSIVKRIRIVPDRQLSAFPFEALLLSDPASMRSFAGLDYAIHHFQISYASSATLLLDANVLPDQAEPYEVLGLAWASSESDAAQSRFPRPGEKFSDIPGTAAEVEQIEGFVEGEYFKGKAATERVFKELAPQYGLIHLALHGRASDGEPYLAFPEAGEGEDGVLYLEELYKISLKARLTVLSACETGKGVMHEGEGVMSMARGFGIAGSPSAVMSLWEVDDQVSTEIMAGFYDGLAAGKPIDVSLRDAKMAHLAKADEYSASPFFWATYIPVGANAPIQLKVRPSRWPSYLGVGVAFSVFVLAFFLRRQRKQSA